MPDGYDINWMAVLLMAAVGFAAMAALFAVSYVLAPRRPSEAKDIPYECGIPPAPFIWSQIFDVEAVFLFPWAVVFLKTIPAVFYEMLIFIGILFFGVIYGWRKGVLQWR